MMKNQLSLSTGSTNRTNLQHLAAGFVLFAFTLPLAARAQVQDPANAPPTAVPALSPPTPPTPAPRPRVLEDRALRRVYVKVRPFVSLTSAFIFETSQRPAGVQLDYGIEYNGRRGLWVGLDVSPFVLTDIAHGIPYFAGRLNLGYSDPRFAVGASLGSGIFSSLLSFGPAFRFGRLDGTHARLRVSFSLLPLYYFPSGDIEVNIKVHPRVWVHVNVGGDLNVTGMYSTLGTQILLRGRGGPGSDLLTVGAGVSWLFLSVGPMATIGYEHRF
jgi:hypothetical protein